MYTTWTFSLLIAALTGRSTAGIVPSEDCITTTTTIPYLGSGTTTTTLPQCSSTVVVVVETPLAICSTSASTTSSTTTVSTSSTSTASASSTPTIKPCLNIDPLCTAEGYNVEYLPNPFIGYSSGQIQSNYYIVDHLKPIASSLTNVTYYPQTTFNTGTAIYPNSSYPAEPYYVGETRETNGGIVVDANNFTMVYYGLFRAPADGVFQLCTSADNQNDLYFGDGNAYSCLTGTPGTAADPILTTTGGSFVNEVLCANFTLLQGLYYPIRSIAGNWQGPSAFSLTYAAPGTASGSDDWTEYAYPHACGIYL